MEAIHDLVSLVSDKVGEIADSDLVIGDPIALGEVTVVPLSRVSVGFGSGGGRGEGEGPRRKGKRSGRGKGLGGGGGGGGKIRPVGVIIFSPDGVEVQPIPDKKGAVEKLLDKLPDFALRIKAVFGDEDDDAAEAAAAEATAGL